MRRSSLLVCIIAVAWSPKQPLVSKVINSDADLLVAAPISPKLILDRSGPSPLSLFN